MKVYRLLSHLGLCALLLSCAMPVLGSFFHQPSSGVAEATEEGSYVPPTELVKKGSAFPFIDAPVEQTQKEQLQADVKNALDELNAIKGNSPESATQRRAARQKWLDAKTAADQFGQAPVAIHVPGGVDKEQLEKELADAKAALSNAFVTTAELKAAQKDVADAKAALDAFNKGGAAALPVATPAQPEGWMAYSARIASAPFRALGRGVLSTGTAIGGGLNAVGYVLDAPRRAIIGALAYATVYAAYPFIRLYSASRGTSVELPVSDKIQNALLKANFKGNAELARLQKEANDQIEANKQDTKVDPSAAVQAFLDAAQQHKPAVDIMTRMLQVEAQKNIQLASDEYAKLRAKNASEAELNEARQAMEEATEELELIRAGGVGLGGATAISTATGEKAEDFEFTPANEALKFGPSGEEEAPATPQAEVAAVKAAISGEGVAHGPMTFREYMAAERRARAQQPQHSARGALTRAGHLARLEQRQATETARRVANSILADNSLPTESNLDQWVREFVSMYESPYVMTRLSQTEKEQYIALIKEFFKKAHLSGDFDPNEVAILYDRLIQGSPRLQEAIKARLEPWMEQKAEAAEQEFDVARAQSDKASADRIAAEKTGKVEVIDKAKAAEQQALKNTRSKYMTVLKWTVGVAVVGGATYLGLSWLTGNDPRNVMENAGNLMNWSYAKGGKLKEKIFGTREPVTEQEAQAAPKKSWTQTLSLGYLGNPATGEAAAPAPKKGWVEWGTFGYFGKPKATVLIDPSQEGRYEAALGGTPYEPGDAPASEVASVERPAAVASVTPTAPVERPATVASVTPTAAPVRPVAPAKSTFSKVAGGVSTVIALKSKADMISSYGKAAINQAAIAATNAVTKDKTGPELMDAAIDLGLPAATMRASSAQNIKKAVLQYYKDNPTEIPAAFLPKA